MVRSWLIFPEYFWCQTSKTQLGCYAWGLSRSWACKRMRLLSITLYNVLPHSRTCMHACTRTYSHTHTHTHTHVHTHTHTHICTCARTHTHTHGAVCLQHLECKYVNTIQWGKTCDIWSMLTMPIAANGKLSFPIYTLAWMVGGDGPPSLCGSWDDCVDT